MRIERTYTIGGAQVPISSVRELLKFYLRNAIGIPSSELTAKQLNFPDMNSVENQRSDYKGMGLLVPLAYLLDHIEPSFVSIVKDEFPLWRGHTKQSAHTEWRLQYEGDSRLVVVTDQTSYWGSDRRFTAHFTLEDQSKGLLRYRTNLDINTEQELRRSGLLPLEMHIHDYHRNRLDSLLYDAVDLLREEAEEKRKEAKRLARKRGNKK